MRRAVFLDRDGVLNELVPRDGLRASPRRADEFRLVPEATKAVERFRAAGLAIFVVTNQPDVARGHLPAAELELMHAKLRRTLHLDDIAVCPHDDTDGCSCRKPKPGMLMDLALRWSVDLAVSVLVGDSWRDVEAGQRAGCPTVLVARSEAPPLDGPAAHGASAVVATLGEAVKWVLNMMEASREPSR